MKKAQTKRKKIAMFFEKYQVKTDHYGNRKVAIATDKTRLKRNVMAQNPDIYSDLKNYIFSNGENPFQEINEEYNAKELSIEKSCGDISIMLKYIKGLK